MCLALIPSYIWISGMDTVLYRYWHRLEGSYTKAKFGDNLYLIHTFKYSNEGSPFAKYQ